MTKAHPVENDVKREMRKRLEKRGWLRWPAAAGPFSKLGVSDTLALRKGVIAAIEAKLSKEKGSDHQEDFMRVVREHGGLSFLCNQRTLDDGSFDAFLTEAEALGDRLERWAT